MYEKLKNKTILVCLKMVVRRHPACECENGSNLFCIWRYQFQILSVGTCKHSEHWGIIFEGASKSVLYLLLASVYRYIYDGSDNSDLIIIIVYNPQSRMLLLLLSQSLNSMHTNRESALFIIIDYYYYYLPTMYLVFVSL